MINVLSGVEVRGVEQLNVDDRVRFDTSGEYREVGCL